MSGTVGAIAEPGALPPITHPFAEPPAPGEALEVAEGILWARLPLPMKLDHVNIFALEEPEGWTLVDTGLDWKAGRLALEALLAGPLGGRPVLRVVLTHHHPDHIGRAGPLAEEGAEILATRTGWLLGRMLQLDPQDRPTPEQIAFRRRAGVSGAALAAYAAERPFNFADCVAPIPLGFTALEEGMWLAAGGRRWQVRLGDGHAPDHATFWSEDGGLVLAGDQILPGISPNIGVYPTEPKADPLSGWLASCARFRPAAAEHDPLILCGHQLPFHGSARRLDHLIENHAHALDRLRRALAEEPRPAVALFGVLFHREIAESQFGLALAETIAHLNHLATLGEIRAVEDAAGIQIWQPS
ncbi:MAG: MBL fold metallo-hydrolase [Pseudomonadota bacterium]